MCLVSHVGVICTDVQGHVYVQEICVPGCLHVLYSASHARFVIVGAVVEGREQEEKGMVVH
jgi:hypothetical protein